MHPVGVVVASVTVENASPSASARACRGGPGGKRDCGKGWGGRPGDGGGEVAGHDGACRVGLCRLRWARRIGVGARTWHKAEASVCGTLAQVVMPQKVAGAAGGGGGGRSTCASTVEAAQRSDMALLTTMAAEVAVSSCFRTGVWTQTSAGTGTQARASFCYGMAKRKSLTSTHASDCCNIHHDRLTFVEGGADVAPFGASGRVRCRLHTCTAAPSVIDRSCTAKSLAQRHMSKSPVVKSPKKVTPARPATTDRTTPTTATASSALSAARLPSLAGRRTLCGAA